MLQPPIHLLSLRSVRRSARTLRHVFALHSRPNNNTPACRPCRGGGGARSLSLLVPLRQLVCVVLLRRDTARSTRSHTGRRSLLGCERAVVVGGTTRRTTRCAWLQIDWYRRAQQHVRLPSRRPRAC